ncbi:hypothetical protein FDP41_010790 [Naegleria fowleri]|uniref:Uncharacterized protein n=1 Tax=Naegleria fowleri TaxID=5763 RepID=A0A6A5C6S6_NAEFO|nr:uncharacterized protein FDP41_010790 [Naegleria fowleri]KAF0982811.1 hypothetical protein FDP41_010790 [Naegleria fowleri]
MQDLARLNHDPTLLDQHNQVQIPEERTWFELYDSSSENVPFKALFERMDHPVPLERLFLVGLSKVAAASSSFQELQRRGVFNSNLKRLELVSMAISDEKDAPFLLGHPSECVKSSLQELRVVGCGLSDEGLKELLLMQKSSLKQFEKLELLDLSENHLTSEGVRNVLAQASFPSLKYLFLEGNSIPMEDEEEVELYRSSLRQLIPSLEIVLFQKKDYSLNLDQVFTQQLFKSIHTLASLLQEDEYSSSNTKDGDNEEERKKQGTIRRAAYMFKLANVLENPSILSFESKQVTNLFLMAAMYDFPPAQYHMGCIFFKNYCVNDTITYNQIESKFFPKSNYTARRWFEKAAAHRHPLALLKLAHYHEFGVSGVEQSEEKAFELTLKAAESENECSQAWLQLGEKYLGGIGTKRDVSKGMEYLTKAAESENEEAMKLLATIYHNGLKQQPEQDEKSQPQESSQTLIDDEKALYWFTKMCEQNPENAQAFYMVGLYHLGAFGEIENQDLQEGIHALTSAAKLGHDRACYQLGGFWMQVQNPEMSYFWFREGSRLGNEACEEALKQFEVIDSRNPDL